MVEFKKDGYILWKYDPCHPQARNGFVPYHRWLMEQKLKRFLKPDEMVSHKDGNKYNNDLPNLILWKKRDFNGYTDREKRKKLPTTKDIKAFKDTFKVKGHNTRNHNRICYV